MLFNSIPFLLFFVLFFAFWPVVRKNNTSKWIWITAMSYLFYAWWDWRFLFLLIGTGSIDYLCGKALYNSTKRRKLWLYISICSNLGSLAFFKYYNWFVTEINTLFQEIGIVTCYSDLIPEYSFILPLGISFYTFNALSYTIDLYRNKTVPAKSWLHFMSFIAFFPHLVAGPIIRARDVLQQLNRENSVGNLQIYNGIKTCIWGFFQKMVLADNLAVFVNNQFENGTETDALLWWICMIAFSFQIYFDFNGYSTIARGLAKLCGIHFRLNFNHPYRASSFKEFWQSWHISLSSFFRDYVYIPLGGNRISKLRTEINRWITMLLSGLWHGANFTFLIWGAIHALFLSLEHNLLPQNFKQNLITKILKHFIVLCVVLIAWVFFRSNDVNQALIICKTLFSFETNVNVLEIVKSNVFIWLIVSILIEYSPLVFHKPKVLKSNIIDVLFLAVLIASILYFRGPEQDFIYFQF